MGRGFGVRRNNPYPGLTKVKDRHGKTRWRFRKKGCVSCYIQGKYGSKEFDTSYQSALSNKPFDIPKSRAKPGTFDWLIEQYKRTKTYHDLGLTYKKTLPAKWSVSVRSTDTDLS